MNENVVLFDGPVTAENLWEVIASLQGKTFYTARGFRSSIR